MAKQGMPKCRVDDDWHHVAVSWEGHTGLATLYFDGKEVAPFWRASGGQVDQQYPSKGGVDKHVAAGTARFDHGEPPRLSVGLGRCYVNVSWCKMSGWTSSLASKLHLNSKSRVGGPVITMFGRQCLADNGCWTLSAGIRTLSTGCCCCRLSGAGPEPGVLWRLLLALAVPGRHPGSCACVEHRPHCGMLTAPTA